MGYKFISPSTISHVMKKVLLFTFLLTLLILPNVFAYIPNAFILSNTIDKNLSEDFTGFLKAYKVNLTHANASDFEKIKNSSFIVILGGHESKEGIGAIVQQVLSKEEQSSIKIQPGRAFFVKYNVFAPKQTILVLAGSNRTNTQLAENENREKTLLILQQKNASISIESFGIAKSATYNTSFFTHIAYSVINTGKMQFKPTIDLKIISHSKTKVSDVYSNSDISNLTYFIFQPRVNWFENLTQDIPLQTGNYTLILKLREREMPYVISEDSENFTIT